MPSIELAVQIQLTWLRSTPGANGSGSEQAFVRLGESDRRPALSGRVTSTMALAGLMVVGAAMAF